MNDVEKHTVLKSVTNCLHPIKVYNKYLDEYMFVPCRKCIACQNAYALNLQTRIENECKQHSYSFFFTLTYDNEHLPMYRLVTDCPFIDEPCFMSNRYADINTSFYEFVNDFPQALKQQHLGFGYCCKSDVQKFLKRLRRHIQTDKRLKNISDENKKIRYFICSEYGPKTFRPHYHGILWTDCQQLSNLIPELIRSCWSLCHKDRIDIQLVNGNAPQYVAKYVNGNTDLPKVLQLKFTRTFHLASKNPVLGDFKVDNDLLRKMLFDGVSKQSVPNTDKLQLDDVPISNSYYNTYFPKCQGFSSKSHHDKLSILKTYFNLASLAYTRTYDDVKLTYCKSLTEWKYGLPYQDRRFCMRAYQWCNRYHITADDYLYYLERLYSNRMLTLMSDDYDLQEQYIQKFNTKFKALKFYPLLVNSLPLSVDYLSFLHSPLNSHIKQLGFTYFDLYKHEQLIDLSSYLSDYEDTNHLNMNISIQCDGNKNKVLNEKLSHLYDDY